MNVALATAGNAASSVEGGVLERCTSAPSQLIIDGKWVDATSGETYEAFDPTTERAITSVASAGLVDAERTIAAALDAFCTRTILAGTGEGVVNPTAAAFRRTADEECACYGKSTGGVAVSL